MNVDVPVEADTRKRYSFHGKKEVGLRRGGRVPNHWTNGSIGSGMHKK